MDKIFYIALFKEKGVIKDTVLSKIIEHNQSLSPGYKTVIIDDNITACQFIKTNYSPIYLTIFDQLVPYAYKADFLRLLLLYKYGGVYIDLGMRLAIPLKELVEDNQLVLVKDFVAGGIANGFMFVRHHGSSFIRICIAQLIKNVLNLSYGTSFLDITGPDMLGRVFRKLYGPYHEGQHAPKIKIVTNAGGARITFKGRTQIHGKDAINYSEIISKIEKKVHPECSHHSFLYSVRYIYKPHINTGTWRASCGPSRLGKDRLYAYLRKLDGTYALSSFPIHLNSERKIQYSNIDGRFRRETPYTIAKNIFQTHKSRDYIKRNKQLSEAANSWIKDSTFHYRFYDDTMCDDFMKNNFGGMTYEAYQKCPLAVMKADLWRYCIIYKYGGIYADADTILKVRSPTFLVERDALLVVVPENDTHFCQWVFAAPQASPILKQIIDLSVSRILALKQLTEHFIHECSGPGVFSDGIINYLGEKNKPTFTIGEERHIHQYQNYLDPCLYVFEAKGFHSHKIQHLFSGQWRNGWCQERAHATAQQPFGSHAVQQNELEHEV